MKKRDETVTHCSSPPEFIGLGHVTVTEVGAGGGEDGSINDYGSIEGGIHPQVGGHQSSSRKGIWFVSSHITIFFLRHGHRLYGAVGLNSERGRHP